MEHNAPSSLTHATRCKHRTPSGRQCRSVSASQTSGLCERHTQPRPHSATNLLEPLTAKAARFQNAQGINHSLGALYSLLAQGKISPRRASVLAYISSLLLRSLTAIDNDLYPEAGVPQSPATAPSPEAESPEDDELSEDTESESESESDSESESLKVAELVPESESDAEPESGPEPQSESIAIDELYSRSATIDAREAEIDAAEDDATPERDPVPPGKEPLPATIEDFLAAVELTRDHLKPN